MNKILYFMLIVFILFFSCTKSNNQNVVAEDNDIVKKEHAIFSFEKYLHENYGDWNIQYRQIGNFTNSGSTEEFVFFENPKRRLNPGDENRISDVYFFIYNEEQVIQETEIPLRTLAYSSVYEKTINTFAKSLNVKPKPYFITDLNNNKQDELLFFTLTGMNFGVVGLEYNKNDFKVILDSSKYTKILNKVEIIEKDVNETKLRIVGQGNAHVESGKKDWYDVIWNSDLFEYTLIDQGVE